MRRWVAIFLFLLLTTVLALQAQQNSSNARVSLSDGATSSDWPAHGGTNLSWRYSSLAQINTTNVKNLAPVWAFQTGDYQDGLQSTPIVVNGVLYLSAMNDVFALDGATGSLIWQYKYHPIPGVAPRRSFGVAVADGKVFLGTIDAHVVALDQKTGEEVWNVAADDASSCHCAIQGAPLIAKDKVIVGEGGAPRGRLSAFDLKTGRLEWRFAAIPKPGEKGHETWQGNSWKAGGVSLWTTGSYDSGLNVVYWGTGDPAHIFNGSMRQGENLYANCILALDVDTGKLRWYYQEIPHDVWDYDAGWEMVLIDREIRGRMRKLLVQFSKSGFLFVLDRTTGELLGTYPYVENYNFVKGITEKGELVGRKEPVVGQTTTICPGNIGAKSWNQTAYSPQTSWIYVPILEMCNDLNVPQTSGREPEGMGGTFVFNAPPGHATAYAHLDAFDPVTGARKWTYPYKYELMASILATAGDLVLTGDPEGFFFALDAHSGQKLWSFQTGSGLRGSAVTYMVNGRQYIATPTGLGHVSFYTTGIWPEASTWHYGSVLMTFALPN